MMRLYSHLQWETGVLYIPLCPEMLTCEGCTSIDIYTHDHHISRHSGAWYNIVVLYRGSRRQRLTAACPVLYVRRLFCFHPIYDINFVLLLQLFPFRNSDKPLGHIAGTPPPLHYVENLGSDAYGSIATCTVPNRDFFLDFGGVPAVFSQTALCCPMARLLSHRRSYEMVERYNSCR